MLKKQHICIISIAFFLLFYQSLESKKVFFDYKYDPLNRITDIKSSNEDSISFQYDKAGNILVIEKHKGEKPVPEIDGLYVSEPLNIINFNASQSSDDNEIIKYQWDFGDGTKGIGKTLFHIYKEPGQYTLTLTVYDSAMYSNTTSQIVNMVVKDAPIANSGNNYEGAAGGPPVYFDASQSSDDYGIVKYLWDVDDRVDSDNDGNFTNDMDVVGIKPFYTYNEAGEYTATLTVVDGAGQESMSKASVNIVSKMAPQVICVPWRAIDPTIPHETYSGKSISLKGIVRGYGNLTYQWDFGVGAEGFPLTPAEVTNKFAIQTFHTYDGEPGTRYTAKLTVCNEDNLCGHDNYYIVIRSENLKTKTNIAIDEGLWWLHKQQKKTNGSWKTSISHGTFTASPTASSVQAFEINGHLQNGNHMENPYAETVHTGLNHLFTTLTASNISKETYYTNDSKAYTVNPDTNGNGIGLGVNEAKYSPYETGMVMDAIASSNQPLAFALTGGNHIKYNYYFEILTDMVDMYAWGQCDSGSYRGGWRYTFDSSDADNSACQWAAIGMMAAEDNFDIYIPEFVKKYNDRWLTFSYDGSGFRYNTKEKTDASTPSGMVQLAFCEKTTDDYRWITSEKLISDNWFSEENNYYAAYALVKAFRLALPEPVVHIGADQIDWYNDPDKGLKKYIIDAQEDTNGENWGSWDSEGHGGRSLDTPWAVMMLTPSLFVPPPVANAGEEIIWGWGVELTFNASDTIHIDPSRKIVKYEWDFNGDDIWDVVTTEPTVKYTFTRDIQNQKKTRTQESEIILVKLRVTDDNDPPQTDTTIKKVTLKESPFQPYAEPGGPYQAIAGVPVILYGSASFDIDTGDNITQYLWDLDNDGTWFDDIDISSNSATIQYTFFNTGVHNIGLKVKDSGAFNDNVPLESLPSFSSVDVLENEKPFAHAGGPYNINSGVRLQLDASESYDPYGENITYAWDLDNDGAFDDSNEEKPFYTWNNTGEYIVSVKVVDILAENAVFSTATVLVTENEDDNGNDIGLKKSEDSNKYCFVSNVHSPIIYYLRNSIRINLIQLINNLKKE